MLVVLDTNILVSALLSPFGPPARVLDLVLNGDIRIAYDDRMMAEYREVLARPKFSFAPEDVNAVLTYLELDGQWLAARPLMRELPDMDDLPFLEAATEAGAVLVTGNISHYPAAARGETQVLTPAAFLTAWQERRAG